MAGMEEITVLSNRKECFEMALDYHWLLEDKVRAVYQLNRSKANRNELAQRVSPALSLATKQLCPVFV